MFLVCGNCMYIIDVIFLHSAVACEEFFSTPSEPSMQHPCKFSMISEYDVLQNSTHLMKSLSVTAAHVSLNKGIDILSCVANLLFKLS